MVLFNLNPTNFKYGDASRKCGRLCLCDTYFVARFLVNLQKHLRLFDLSSAAIRVFIYADLIKRKKNVKKGIKKRNSGLQLEA